MPGWLAEIPMLAEPLTVALFASPCHYLGGINDAKYRPAIRETDDVLRITLAI